MFDDKCEQVKTSEFLKHFKRQADAFSVGNVQTEENNYDCIRSL